MRLLFSAYLHLLICTLVLASVTTQPEPRANFLENAAAGWERIRSGLTSFSGSVSFTQNSSDPRWTPAEVEAYSYRHHVAEFWCIPGARKVDEVIWEKNGNHHRRVLCFNPQDAFMLQQQPDSNGLFIRMYGRDTPSGEALKRYINTGMWGIDAPYSVDHDTFEPMGEVMKRPGFALGPCRYVQLGGRELVEVHFEYRHVGRSAQLDPGPVDVIATVDPRADWRIVSTVTSTPRLTTDVTISYGGDGRFPGCPFKVVIHNHYGPEGRDKGNDTEISEFGPLTFGPTPPEEFRLSAYGIPEPSVARRGLSRLMWTGITLLIFGVLVYYGQRRRTRSLKRYSVTGASLQSQ